MRWQSAFALFPLASAWLHVALAPFTKVEESFTLQAVHDILAFGFDADAVRHTFDHVTFTGAVPRSFVGPLVLSILSYPAVLVGQLVGYVRSSAHAGLVVRLTLSTLHCLALNVFANSLWHPQHPRQERPRASLHVRTQRQYAKRFFCLVHALQFHDLFWAGRTTPNGVVMPAVVVGLAWVLQPEKQLGGLILLTASAVISRLELIGILAPACLVILLTDNERESPSTPQLLKGGKPRPQQTKGLASRLTAVVLAVASSGFFALAVTVLLDTYMWNRPFRIWNPLNAPAPSRRGIAWPELEGVLFNVVEGKSVEWGTSPWHEYASKHIPKLVSFSGLFAFVGIPSIMINRSCSALRSALWIATFHVGLMSILAHKEARFVSYTVPLLNAVAAHGAAVTWQARSATNSIRFVLRLGVVSLLLMTAGLTIVSTVASMHNYPGGQALQTLRTIVGDQNATVHIDVLPAMTGVSLFQSAYLDQRQRRRGAFGLPSLPSAMPERNDVRWAFDKSEEIFDAPSTSYGPLIETFTHIVSEDSQCHRLPSFALMRSQDGEPLSFGEFDMVRLLRPNEYKSRIRTVGLRATLSDVRLALPFEFRQKNVVWLCEKKKHSLVV